MSNVSPYVMTAARHAGIVVDLHPGDRPSNSEMTIGAHADHDPLTFARSIREGRTPWLELEPSAPLEPLWKAYAAALFLGIFIGILLAVL